MFMVGASIAKSKTKNVLVIKLIYFGFCCNGVVFNYTYSTVVVIELLIREKDQTMGELGYV